MTDGGYGARFFDDQMAGSSSSARVVLPLLFEYYRPNSIIDVGCGVGTWLKAAVSCGVTDLMGLDGDYVDRSRLLIDERCFQACDLGERIELRRRFDLAISVEVAEHLPYHRAETFVADLCKLSDVVLFSAAVPYQGGTNHVNEQWLEFWAILFRRHGYVACDLLRKRIWGNSEVEFWYTQNLMVFCKSDLATKLFPSECIAARVPLSFSHPLTLLVNAARYRPLSAQALDLELQDYASLLEAYLSGESTLPLLKMPAAVAEDSGRRPALFPAARVWIEDAGARLRERETRITTLSAALAAKEEEAERLASALQEREYELSRTAAELTERRHAVEALRRSWSWRLTAPLRAVADMGLTIRRLLRHSERDVSMRSKLRGLLQWCWFGRQVRASGLFDERYYCDHNPDVAQQHIEPLRHFFMFGAAEARNPHPLFDVRHYFGCNPDVARSSVNPLVHYLKWGAYEGRNPHPDFHSSFYLDRNPEVRRAGLNPLAHYMGPGIVQGLDPNPWFDTSEYLECNPHVALKGINPLLHHLEHREAEWRRSLAQLPIPPQAAPASAEGSQPPAGMRIDPRTTPLRASLRAECELSGLSSLDSEYHSIPLVSVIIPCYNYGCYLEDAILSAMLACSYPMEILVVDDGSTDLASIAEVQELASRHKFQLFRQENTGQSGARLSGLRNSRGRFIQFLDADDLLAPGKIDFQVDLMTADTGIDIAVCEYALCDADGGNRRLMQPSTLAGFALSAEDFLIRWERGFSLPIHCALFRRELLGQEQFQGITRAGKEDWIFWIAVSSKSPRFHFHPEVLATYRIHGQNTYTNREAMGLDFLRACMYVLQAGLNSSENFVQESIEHFRKAYLGSIKHEAIVWSRTRPAE